MAMIEILLLLAMVAVSQPLLARKKQRYAPGFAAITFTVTLTLSTLAADTVIAVDIFTSDFEENFYAMSVKGQWQMRGNTLGETPIEVGFNHSDYTVGEIAEKLVADEANVRGNKIAQEQSRRQVRPAGTFGSATETDEALNDGKPMKTPLRFTVGNGFNLQIYARNRSGATLTTGAAVQLTGTVYGRYGK